MLNITASRNANQNSNEISHVSEYLSIQNTNGIIGLNSFSLVYVYIYIYYINAYVLYIKYIPYIFSL